MQKVSSFCEQKETKKLCQQGFACTGLSTVGSDPFEQKFFASFFQKRRFFSLRRPTDFTNYLSGQTLIGKSSGVGLLGKFRLVLLAAAALAAVQRRRKSAWQKRTDSDEIGCS